MRLILTTAALQLILLSSSLHDSANGAFTTTTNHRMTSQTNNKQQLQRLPSFTTHLNLVKSDPYESLLDRLDVPSDSAPLTTITKTAVTASTPTPPIPPPAPVVTATVTTPPIESIPPPPESSIDTVTDTVTSSVQQAFDNLNSAVQQQLTTTPTPAVANTQNIPTIAQYLKNTPPPPLPDDPNRVPTLAEYFKNLVESFDPEQTATAARSLTDDTTATLKSLTDSVTSSLNDIPTVATKAATTSAAAVQSSPGLENIKKGLAVLKDNAVHMMDTPLTTPSISTPDFETAQRGLTIFQDNISPLSTTLQQLGDAIQFEEYKTLYVALGGVLFGMYQRSAGREEASQQFQDELMVAQQKADEAVAAALEAASEAQKAKILALGMESKGREEGGKDVLGESRMKELQVEKMMMSEELNRVNRELSVLKSQLSQVLSVKHSSPIGKPVDEATFDHIDGHDDDFISPADDMILPRDPEEDKRIIEVLKEMDEENRMAATKPGIMQLEAEKKAAAEMKKESTATKAKKKTTTRKKKETTKKTTTTASKKTTTTTAKKTNTKSKTAKKIVIEKVLTPINGEANGHLPTDDDGDESSKTTTKKKKTTTRKKQRKTKTTVAKKEIEEEPVTAAEAAPPSPVPPPPIVANEQQQDHTTDHHPWAKLASSTLSRKTIKELSTFLEERGVPVTTDDGKKLAKKELVSAVQEIL